MATCQCGNLLAPDSRFCGKCGRPRPQLLPQYTAAPQPEAQLPHMLSTNELYKQFDFDHNGSVSRDEFIHGIQCLQARGPVGSLVYGDYTGDALPPAAAEAMANQCTSASAIAAAQMAAQKAFDGRASGGLPAPREETQFGAGISDMPVEKSPYVIRVPLQKPTVPGGIQFYGDVPAHALTFAPAELCATPDPDAALAPTPQVPVKKWYNTYLYVPEERRAIKEGGQFLERFVQGPDGEWIDVPKSRRMAQHIQKTAQAREEEAATRKALLSGKAYSWTGSDADHQHVGLSAYTDPYSGERLVVYKGQLLPKPEILAQHNVHESALKEMFGDSTSFDFDNFRIPWPFGRPYRNKQVSQHAYEWFDRQNPFIPSDNSYEMLELPSIYVDKENWEKWRAGGGPTPADFVQDVSIRARHFDDYPYKM